MVCPEGEKQDKTQPPPRMMDTVQDMMLVVFGGVMITAVQDRGLVETTMVVTDHLEEMVDTAVVILTVQGHLEVAVTDMVTLEFRFGDLEAGVQVEETILETGRD